MKRITLVAALGALLFVAPSCSEAEAATVAGKYDLDIDATAAGIVKAGGEAVKGQEELIKKSLAGSVTLNADLTCSGTMGAMKPSTFKGTFTIEDGALTVTQTHENGQEKADSFEATLKDGVLNLTKGEGDKAMTMVFKTAAEK
jgi:hypothetical protein